MKKILRILQDLRSTPLSPPVNGGRYADERKVSSPRLRGDKGGWYVSPVLVAFSVLMAANLLSVNGVHATLAVALVADPDIRNIPPDADSRKITITTRTNQAEVQFRWSLTGPGKLTGARTEAGIVYLPPANPEDRTGQATVTVTVTTANGETAAESLTFMFGQIFPQCPAETNTLEEVQKSLPEHVQQYRTFKKEETQGLQRNVDLIRTLTAIICDLKAIEALWEQKNRGQPSPELAENLRKTQTTRQQYEKEWLDRVNE